MKKLSHKISTALSLIITVFAGAMLIICIGIFTGGCANAQKNETPVKTESDTSWNSAYLVMFDFSNIDDAIYSRDDGIFYLEYNDPDAWDYDNLAYLSSRDEWYGNYIRVEINNCLVSEFLEDWDEYISLRNQKEYNPRQYELCYKWGVLEEYYTSCGDFNFELVPIVGDWFKGSEQIRHDYCKIP